MTTGEDGTIKVENLQPGTYTVTELTENRYEPQKAQTVEVKGGETAAVDFSNILKRGDLKVTKTSEDGLVEGMKFHLYGTSLSVFRWMSMRLQTAQVLPCFLIF